MDLRQQVYDLRPETVGARFKLKWVLLPTSPDSQRSAEGLFCLTVFRKLERACR